MLVNVGRTPLDSDQSAISADGEWVVFVTAGQVFERSRLTGTTALISAAAGSAPANGESWSPVISADGRWVVFWSHADNLAPGGTSLGGDLFMRDRQTDVVERVSSGTINETRSAPAISADGRFVAFALNPGTETAAFVRDRQTGTTEFVGHGGSPAMSADGRFIAFTSNGAPPRGGDVYVRDQQTGETELISVGSNGASADAGSGSAAISADGRFVAFISSASNLLASAPVSSPGGTGGDAPPSEVYVRDRQRGTTEIASLGVGRGRGWSSAPTISADGRFVAYAVIGASQLPPGTGIYLRDRQTGSLDVMTLSPRGEPANGLCLSPSISADGRYIAFASDASNLVAGDDNGDRDVFVAERG